MGIPTERQGYQAYHRGRERSQKEAEGISSRTIDDYIVGCMSSLV